MAKTTILAAWAALFCACPTHYPDDRTVGPPASATPGSIIDTPPPPPTSAQPVFGALVQAQQRTVAVSGGTLTVLKGSQLAVAADPDRDRLFVVDLKQKQKIAEVALQAGDEPGRVIEDYAGRVHVVLRGGAVLTIANQAWQAGARRDVCAEPRGVAYDQGADAVHVACAGGELVTLPAAGGGATRTVNVGGDLRDVVVNGSKLLVSRFRDASLVSVASDGTVESQSKPQTRLAAAGVFSPNAAWRMIAAPGSNQVFMLHQRGQDQAIDTQAPGGYGGSVPCSGIVHSTVSALSPATPGTDQASAPPAISSAVLAVDVAFSGATSRLAVIAAGNAYNPGEPTVFELAPPSKHANGNDCQPAEATTTVPGEPTAAAYDEEGNLFVQTREPAAVTNAFSGERIALSTDSRADSGHAIFHANAGGQVACASCHLEGGDDSRTWTFTGSGARRTQNLRGGISGTEPFHWSGDQPNISVLMHGVFEHRMSGPTLDEPSIAAVKRWVDTVPLLDHAPPADPAAVARGEAIFQSDAAACGSCHAGAALTDNSTTSVGTGGAFQVPSLRGLSFRPPYLHDGRAQTIRDRFDGNDAHGSTSQLSAAELADLIAYLQTL
jgi:mono/diheme cytochrome c family protein